jgi:hypothetical protein
VNWGSPASGEAERASPPDWCANRAALRSAGTNGLFRRASGPRTCSPACLLQVFRPSSAPKSHRRGARVAGASARGGHGRGSGSGSTVIRCNP